MLYFAKWGYFTVVHPCISTVFHVTLISSSQFQASVSILWAVEYVMSLNVMCIYVDSADVFSGKLKWDFC